MPPQHIRLFSSFCYKYAKYFKLTFNSQITILVISPTAWFFLGRRGLMLLTCSNKSDGILRGVLPLADFYVSVDDVCYSSKHLVMMQTVTTISLGLRAAAENVF